MFGPVRRPLFGKAFCFNCEITVRAALLQPILRFCFLAKEQRHEKSIERVKNILHVIM